MPDESPFKPVPDRLSRTEVLTAWPNYQVACSFARLRESDTGTIRAELTVYSRRPDSPGVLGGPILLELLRAGPEIARQTKDLIERTGPHIPWGELLPAAVRCVLGEWRKPPEPVDYADMQPPDTNQLWLFDRFIPRNQITALMADQRSGKTTLGLAIAIATILGIALPCGWKPEVTGEVLWLDWETDQASIYGMLTEICNGLRLQNRPRGFHYLKMNGPIQHQEQAVQSIVGRIKPILVVADSLGWAAGGDLNKTEVAIPTMSAFSSFNTTMLVLAHYAKSSRVGGVQTKASIYGSGFFEFACRALWELRKESDAGSAFNIGMYNGKLSRGQEGATMAVRLAFDGSRNAVEVLPARIEETPELANRQPLAMRIRELLHDGEMSTDDLTDAVNIGREAPVKSETVRRTLQRMVDIERFGGAQTGRGNQQLWEIKKSATTKPGQSATARSLSLFPPQAGSALAAAGDPDAVEELDL